MVKGGHVFFGAPTWFCDQTTIVMSYEEDHSSCLIREIMYPVIFRSGTPPAVFLCSGV